MLETFISTIESIQLVIGGNMTMIKKRGFLTVNCFVKDGIKKVRQFIKSGFIEDSMIKNLHNVH